MIHKKLFFKPSKKGLLGCFYEPFVFILRFPLDICGNPTTLGCQMTSDQSGQLWRTNGTFPKANILQSWDARYGLKPIPSGSKK